MIKAVLFDMDGLMFDTERLYGRAWQNAAVLQGCKISDEAIFYLMSRGISKDEAKAMIVRGFVEPISKELPLEYAVELNKLIELELEGTIG